MRVRKRARAGAAVAALLLFSHGYRPAGAPDEAVDASDDAAKKLLLAEGYALAGSSYSATGDPLVPVQVASAHRRAVTAAGSGRLLRQRFVGNAGRWGDTSPGALNAEARRADPTTAARYLTFRPGPYPRPYDLAHPGDGR